MKRTRTIRAKEEEGRTPRGHGSLHTTHYRLRTNRGFTLLLASLVASLVIILGIAIFTIVQKEITLSSLGRDSQFAFYAADTGAECALYWDIRYDYYASSTPDIEPRCDGRLFQNVEGLPLPNPVEYPYEISYDLDLFGAGDSGYCVHMTVQKNDTQPRTRIRADGFSTPCSSIATSPRALQRSVEFTY